ncbi:MAG: SdiA-regulated domain-containing protein [Zoogloeaceae bacterium]|jgi:uncharacterized protein YjiK|nr:SdiA-regulated domain-containing protein [Zoogloeaceae bacterium]
MKFGRKKWGLLAFVVFAPLFALAWHMKLPALFWHWAGTFCQAQDARNGSLWLPDYRVSIDALPIEGIASNASGLTHDIRTDTLYLAINHPAEIVELSTEGRVLRRIPVHGVEDLEGLTHVEGDAFFLIDERHQRIHWISIQPDTTYIDVASAPQMGLGVLLNGNLGFEGVAWNNGRDMLFVAKEKAPPRIFHITGLLPDHHDNPLNLQIQEWRPQVDPGHFLRDLSSLSLHDRTGHLLVMSDESRFLAEYSKSGELISMMPLWGGWHGLKRSIPQAEGVTVDNEDALYIVSEPNLFYRFDPVRKSARGN